MSNPIRCDWIDSQPLSDYYHTVQARRHGGPADRSSETEAAEGRRLFGEREGRIALANRRKDPQLLFDSLHRQLGYPDVPQPNRVDQHEELLPMLARRMERLETRLKLWEEDRRGGIDLTQFYEKPE